MATWKALNYKEPIPNVQKPFEIVCPKETDIYDKPPSTHRFDAPVIYSTTAAGSFKSAAITIAADWTYKYDQGGLCLIMNLKDGTKKWLKTGIEFLNDEPWISVVTKDRWADWSLRPLLKPETKSARVQIEAHDDGNLWVYVVDEGNKKIPVREVTWWAEIPKDAQIQVGPCAAKPSSDGGNLVVKYTDFVLNLS